MTQAAKSPPIHEIIDIARSRADVFTYVANFENLPEFCATSAAVRKLTAGPVSQGSIYEQVFRLPLGTMRANATMIEFEPGQRLVYLSDSGPRVRGTCVFSDLPGGCTRMDYTIELTARGFFGLLAPLFHGMLAKQTHDDVQKLKLLLEARATSASAVPIPSERARIAAPSA